MKYSILGFNQELVMQYNNIDVIDLLLLDYIYNAIASPSMMHIIEEDVCYVWLQHSKIHNDLPILQIGEDRLKQRLRKLVKLQLIQVKQISNSKIKGSQAYYSITKKCEDLRFAGGKNYTRSDEQVEKITPANIEASGKNYTSYNPLTNKDIRLKEHDRKEGKKPLFQETNSKQHTIENIHSLYLQLCPNLPKVRILNDKRKNTIYKAYKTYGIETIKEIFTKANSSSFLSGKNDRGWKPDIEWILGDHAVNILEGKYDDRKGWSSNVLDKPWERNVKSVAMTKEEREAEEREADRLEAQGRKARF